MVIKSACSACSAFSGGTWWFASPSGAPSLAEPGLLLVQARETEPSERLVKDLVQIRCRLRRDIALMDSDGRNVQTVCSYYMFICWLSSVHMLVDMWTILWWFSLVHMFMLYVDHCWIYFNIDFSDWGPGSTSPEGSESLCSPWRPCRSVCTKSFARPPLQSAVLVRFNALFFACVCACVPAMFVHMCASGPPWATLLHSTFQQRTSRMYCAVRLFTGPRKMAPKSNL